MDALLSIHNQFRVSLETYTLHDPHLRRIRQSPFEFRSGLLERNPFKLPGVYMLTGGRQVGKTTFCKQFIQQILTRGQAPEAVLFLAGELIPSFQTLLRDSQEFIQAATSHSYLIIDEVNYIKDWDKAIKYLYDAGLCESTSVILTGSDNTILKTAMKRFAGRRGSADKVDFSFHPLTFAECVALKNPSFSTLFDEVITQQPGRLSSSLIKALPELEGHLIQYLIHGGYLPAISEYQQSQTISEATIRTYMDWIVGDMLKHGKQEHYLKDLLRGILATEGTQVSWHSMGKHVPIEHHQTIADYISLLESIEVLTVQAAFDQNKMRGAPKKNRKVYFQDPFIHHACQHALVSPVDFKSLEKTLQDNSLSSPLIEGLCVNHSSRICPTYYIKGTNFELDLVQVRGRSFQPFEIKWASQLRSASLKNLLKYRNGVVLAKTGFDATLVPTIPVIQFLIQTGWHTTSDLSE